MPRFFVKPEELSASSIVLTGENANHVKVLRMKPGEKVTVCDGCGTDCFCTIADIQNGQVCLSVDRREASHSEPRVRVSVYMAYAKSDKFEHVIQKATELGAFEIVAFPSSRCVSRPDDKSLAKKLERWQKIAASAAEQSGRGRIPQVVTVGSYREAVERAVKCKLAVNFYENEEDLSLSAALGKDVPQSVALMTGPEGGYTQEEIDFSAEKGMKICTLGSRILRCETAPLCALSAVMFAAKEF